MTDPTVLDPDDGLHRLIADMYDASQQEKAWGEQRLYLQRLALELMDDRPVLAGNLKAQRTQATRSGVSGRILWEELDAELSLAEHLPGPKYEQLRLVTHLVTGLREPDALLNPYPAMLSSIENAQVKAEGKPWVRITTTRRRLEP